MVYSTSRSLSDVPDVLYHVFSYLDPVHHSRYEYDQAYESRRSLARAARTCRGFTGPALDVLWNRLLDDQPLADLLCELGIATREEGRGDLDVVGKNKPGRYLLPNQGGGGYPDREAQKVFKQRWRLWRGYDVRYRVRDIGDPRQHPGWPRFVEYAARVRAITLYAFDGPAWCGIWEPLRSLTDGAPILPNVASVAFCRISWQALTPGAFALISPSVRKLNFSLWKDFLWPPLDEDLRYLFSKCFSLSPEINQLRLEFPPTFFSSPLFQTTCSCVRRLEIYPQLDVEDLRLLTELPALQHLSVSLSTQSFPEARPSLTFESVTTLVVEGTWANLNSLLDITGHPSMHTLSVTGWHCNDRAAELAKAATQFFHTLATRQPSLSSLSISATHARPPPAHGCTSYGIPVVVDTFEGSLLDLIHPLLALTALRNLKLKFPSYFDIMCTAADLRALAEAFSAIEVLHLDIWQYDSNVGNPFQLPLAPVPPERPRGGPLSAIAHFARNCPRLRVLHMPAMEIVAEASLGPVVDGGEVHTREKHGLRTLVIPKVLLPPGSADLAGKVSEVVRAAFPLVASAFRLERLVVDGDWAVADSASACPECAGGPKSGYSGHVEQPSVVGQSRVTPIPSLGRADLDGQATDRSRQSCHFVCWV